MKKRILSVLLTLVMLIGLVSVMSISASAETVTEYNLWVAGVPVTSENLVIDSADNGAITGSATYDPDSNTLTLNNFSYTGAGYNYSGNAEALIYSPDIDLKIVLKGTNTFAGIDRYQRGIIIGNGSLTFTDSDADDVMGSLKLTATYPVICLNNGALFVENVNLTVINTISPNANPGEAIFATGNISITNSDVKAISGDSNGDDIPEEGATFGITTMGSISVTNSIVSATGYHGGMWANSLSVTNSIVTAAGNSGALCVGDPYPDECLVPTLNGEFTVTAGNDATSATEADASADATYANKYVKIEPVKYDLYIGGVQFTSGNLVIDSADSAAISGSATYNPELNTLTLNNFQYSGPCYINEEDEYLYGALRVEGDNDLRIVFTGQNVIECTIGDERWGLYTNFTGDLHIKAETIDSCLTFIGGDVACGRVPVFDGNFVIYAGNNEANAIITAEDTFASQYSTYSYVRYEPTLMVTFDYGTLGSETKTVLSGETVAPPTPVFAGKVLVGWYTDSSFATEFNFSDAITTNKTIYAKFADYEGDKEALQDAIDALESAVDNVETALDNKVSTDKLTEEIGKLNQAIADAKTYADTQDAALKTTLEAADATMNAAITELQNRVTALETGLNTANGKINTNASDVATLKNDVSTLKTWKDNAQSAIEALQTLTGTQGTNISALQTAVAELQATMNTANGKIAAAENRIATLEGKVSALETAKQELEDAVSALQTAVATKAAAATVNAAIADLQAAIDALEAVKDDYATADATLKAELETAITTAKGAAITAANDALTAAKNELNAAIALKADATTLNAKVAELTTAINNAETVAKAYADSKDAALKSELETAIATAKSDLETLIGGVQSDLDTTKAKLDKAIDDLNKAITDGDKDLSDEIAALNTALTNAKEALEKADADNKAELVSKIETADATLDAAIKAVQKNLDDAKAELNKAIADGDTALDNKISALNEALATAKAALEATDSANKSELTSKIDEADAAWQAAIDALSNELNATNEKVAELETFIIIVCVISGVAFCGCGTLAVFYMIDKKKKI